MAQTILINSFVLPNAIIKPSKTSYKVDRQMTAEGTMRQDYSPGAKRKSWEVVTEALTFEQQLELEQQFDANMGEVLFLYDDLPTPILCYVEDLSWELDAQQIDGEWHDDAKNCSFTLNKN